MSFRASILWLAPFAVLLFLGAVATPARADSRIRINEIFVDGSSNYPDWIELYNAGDRSKNLKGYSLSDDVEEILWTIKNDIIIPARGFRVFICDKKDNFDHTGFSLSTMEGDVALFSPNGGLVDSLTYRELERYSSLGRFPDGQDGLRMFSDPTKGISNQGGIALGNQGQENVFVPVFSRESGLCEQSFMLAVDVPDGMKVFYTVDGSVPDTLSKQYTRPIRISGTTVVRARSYADDGSSSAVATASYIFGEEHTKMAVISLVTAPDNLWDPEVGIYAGGQSMRSGDENWRHNWRRPVSVDFFADDGKWSRLGQFRIFGGASRGRPQKSFAVSLRGPDSKYGLKFRLFPEQERTLYPGFILRNGGDAWLRTQIRDAMLFELVRGQAPHVDMRAYRPAIVYLNGRFWGLYGIRGRVNKPDLLAANHLPDQKVILKDGGSEMADDNGPFADYIPVSEEGDYHDSLVSVDVESLMDYLSIELYTETPDWPDYNHKAWRVKAEGGTWRWVLFDLDRAFNGKRGYRVSHDPFVKILSRKGGHGLMLKDLIRNRKFVRDLCARINAHMLTSFDPDRIERVAHQMAELIRPQMQRQITRWRWDWKLDRVFMTMSDWEDYFDGFVQYGRERPAHMLSIMQKRFGYAEPQRTVLTAGEHEHGSITVEGVPVPGGGFAGMVLGGLSLEIRAVPEPGYRFAGWKEHPGLGALFSLESGQTFSGTALFEPVPE